MKILPPSLSLYVHIPWCVRKCPYCDFNSHAVDDNLPETEYVEALLRDLEQELPAVWGRPVKSIFMGGGTPSLFSGAAIGRLLEGAAQRLRLARGAEITLEANPGAAEAAHFSEYRAAGVNRLSIGVQSLDDAKLQALGRIHSASEAIDAFRLARDAGFDNINLDMMYGLPAQTTAGMLADLRARTDIDRGRIGLVGHSEGGLIAPLVAVRDPDLVAGVVSLAGPAAPQRCPVGGRPGLGGPMRLQRSDGGPVSLWQALLRFLAAFPSLLLFGLGMLWMLVDRDRLTLLHGHRRHAGCRIDHRFQLALQPAGHLGRFRIVDDPLGLAPEIQEVGDRVIADAGGRALAVGLVDPYQALWLGEAQRAENDRVENAEDGRVGSDPESQGEDGDDRESGLLDHLAEGESEVGQERGDHVVGTRFRR